MTITVIIPTYNRTEYLKRCLQSIENQARMADSIFVVARKDDAASRTIAVATRDRGFPVIILDAPQGGVRAALNLAMDNCTTDIMVLTDDDAEAYPEWLELIEKHFIQNPSLGGVGGRDELQYTDRLDLTAPAPTDHIGRLTALGKMYGQHHHPSISNQLEIDCLKGVNMALRREALGNIRIDDSLRGNFAQVAWEIILCFQLRQRGWKLLFDKQLPIKHWVGPRAAEDSRTALALKAGADSIYNSTYAIASHGPLFRSLLFLFRKILIGSRLEPGILGVIYLMIQGDTGAWARFSNQFPALLQGCGAGLAGWLKNSPHLFFSWPASLKDNR